MTLEQSEPGGEIKEVLRDTRGLGYCPGDVGFCKPL